MSTRSLVSRLDLARLRPDRRTLLVAALVINTELLLTFLYVAATDVIVLSPRYLLYPWLWIDVALLAVWKTGRPAADAAGRRRGAAVAAVYGLVLAVAGGLVGLQPGLLDALLGSGTLQASANGATFAGLVLRWRLPPGMGPALLYQGPVVHLVLQPYEVVGYAALAYLFYVGVAEAAGSALSGVLGLFSCVSCAWPVLGAVVTTLFGGGSALAMAATAWPLDLSALVFVSAVGLLYWRPTW
ncbi:MAG: hypothetical protein ABEJ74_04400 [Haloferacaceae archaeon]